VAQIACARLAPPLNTRTQQSHFCACDSISSVRKRHTRYFYALSGAALCQLEGSAFAAHSAGTMSRAITGWFSRDGFPLALLFLAIFLAACVMPAQSDTFWQLRAGQEMWRTGGIMLRDEFTHTVNGGYWPNHESLSRNIESGV
jgi:hypothetical protein